MPALGSNVVSSLIMFAALIPTVACASPPQERDRATNIPRGKGRSNAILVGWLDIHYFL